MRWYRYALLVLASVWFFPVACTGSSILASQIIVRLDTRFMDKGDVPHLMLPVLAFPGQNGDAFALLSLRRVQDGGSGMMRSLPTWRPSSKASAACGAGKQESQAQWTFSLQPPAGQRQGEIRRGFVHQRWRIEQETSRGWLIATDDVGDEYQFYGRYWLSRSGEISPQYSRVEGMGHHFAGFFYGFIAALLLHGLARMLLALQGKRKKLLEWEEI